MAPYTVPRIEIVIHSGVAQPDFRESSSPPPTLELGYQPSIKKSTTFGDWLTLSSPGLIGTTINANASPTGNGSGGSVHISSAAVVQISSTTRIAATGGQSGLGGVVVIDHAPHFDVLKSVDVDGGPSIGLPDFDGSITLNAVECRQRRTTYDTWPTKYWDCTGPSETTVDGIPAEFADGLVNLKMVFNTSNTQIFVFPDGNSISLFFSVVATDVGGFTFRFLQQPFAVYGTER